MADADFLNIAKYLVIFAVGYLFLGAIINLVVTNSTLSGIIGGLALIAAVELYMIANKSTENENRLYRRRHKHFYRKT